MVDKVAFERILPPAFGKEMITWHMSQHLQTWVLAFFIVKESPDRIPLDSNKKIFKFI